MGSIIIQTWLRFPYDSTFWRCHYLHAPTGSVHQAERQELERVRAADRWAGRIAAAGAGVSEEQLAYARNKAREEALQLLVRTHARFARTLCTHALHARAPWLRPASQLPPPPPPPRPGGR
jgi:hypothetical protein